MKKKTIILLVSLFTFFITNVYACGEIKELKSDIGTVTSVNSSNYLITVPEGTESVTLEGTTDYTWVVGYEPRKVSTKEKTELKVDGQACGYGIYTYFVEFKILSNVLAENMNTPNTEEEKTDNIVTNNNETTNDELKLSSLKIEGYEIDFNPDKLQYTLDVDYEVLSLKIIPSSNIDGSVIQVSDNAFSLQEGLNVITVTIKNRENEQTIYTLNVNRLKKKSDNNFLASIIINNYQLNYDPAITSYQLNIGKESMLNITVTPQSTLATTEILGNVDIKDGSVITIRVTAENGISRDYIINIVKEFNIMDYWIYIVIGLLLILFVLLLLIAKQKKDQKKQGPGTIDAPSNTAGEIKEIVPQNNIQVQEATTNAPVSLSTSEPATLKIIEPTNIEITDNVEKEKINEENSPTEIFQL